MSYSRGATLLLSGLADTLVIRSSRLVAQAGPCSVFQEYGLLECGGVHSHKPNTKPGHTLARLRFSMQTCCCSRGQMRSGFLSWLLLALQETFPKLHEDGRPDRCSSLWVQPRSGLCRLLHLFGCSGCLCAGDKLHPPCSAESARDSVRIPLPLAPLPALHPACKKHLII